MFQQSYHIPGVVLAPLAIKAVMPAGASLKHISISTTNVNDGSMDVIGPNGVIYATAALPQNAATGITWRSFSHGSPAHLKKSEEIEIIVGPGGVGTEVADLTLVLTFAN
jgi:hypothetical protein